MTIEMNTFEMRTDAINHVSAGDIWATQRRGVFVVISARAADWRGDDRDVYAHIDQWLTCRPATPVETDKWNRAALAAQARKALRASLGVHGAWTFTGTTLVPPDDATRRLDSYDDRWQPPKPVSLTTEQCAIEREYNEARAALRAN
jgi:hypothetical protein